MARLALSAALFVAAVVAEHTGALTGGWLLGLYLIPYIIVGSGTLREAVEGILGGELLDENFLMAVASIGALCVGQMEEAVAVMWLFQLGEMVEGLAEGRSRRSIAALMDIRPDVARVGDEEIPCEKVAVGTIIEVRQGERVPLDGRVVAGSSELNLAALTGESAPQRVDVGGEVYSGSVNGFGVISVEVTKPFSQSTASRIIALVEGAAERKSRSETFIRRFAHWYTPAVVGAAVLLAVVPTLLGQSFEVWLLRALTFLVVSCPCALVISVPLTFFGGIGAASRMGVLVKGGNYLEALSRLTTVVFDKTGTLTLGQTQYTDAEGGHTQVEGDTVRPEARAAVAALKDLRLVMLSGDKKDVVDSVARRVGIREAHAELLPADKLRHVERLVGRGVTAFVGDGINDAPVLRRADVGIAMGALGSDAAIEAADVVLMDDNLMKISAARRLARRVTGIARQNVVFALGVKALVLALASVGLANLWMAVFADVGVTLLAVLNALRAGRGK